MSEESKREIVGDDDEKAEKKIAGINLKSVAYSALKKVSIVGIIYLSGYMQWSVAWLIGPIILLVVRDQLRVEKDRKRSIAKAIALANEKDVVLARIDDLPAWVFFPDIDRAEWLNRIIKQCWPNVNHFARELIRDKIQHNIARSLEKLKLSGFRFERIILGSVPPRIGGVKVYDKNVGRNEIIMDLDIFYAGDCDISFVLQGMKAGIKDFQLHGMLRVVMKPLITSVPIVGGLQIFFLNNPSIDFNLVGIADVLDMPGLSDLLRRVVTEQVASMMVLPNKFPIKLSDVVEAAELKTPEPEGVLRVHMVEAKNLMKKDISMLGKGKSDPYAIITVGAQEFRTKVIANTVDPKWDFWCECCVDYTVGTQLLLHLFDKDSGNRDDFLGRATIEVSNVAKKGQDDMWITLEQAKHGMVHVRLTWLKLSANYADLKAAIEETQYLRVISMSTAMVTIFIDSAKYLPQPRSSSRPDAYVELRVYKETKQTAVQMRTSDPVWEQGFTFLVTNPETDTLYLKVIDQKTGSELGQLDINLRVLASKPNLEIQKQPFGLLKAGPDSKIWLSTHLRILKRDTSVDVDDTPQVQPLLRQESSISTTSTDLQVPPSPTGKGASATIIKSETNNLPRGVEEEIAQEALPLLASAPPGIIHRSPSTTSSAGEVGLGRIQLTLRYSVQRQRLIVVVHQVANLPLKDPSNIPDPYVKLYLLPERARDTKRKTVVVKDNLNPLFDETFEYLISQGELNGQQLEVTVCTQKQLFYSSTNVMGQVIVDLAQQNLLQPLNAWYDLLPERRN